MKIMVIDVPDDAVARMLSALSHFQVGVAESTDVSKPPTQGVVAGMGEQSTVMVPSAPPTGLLRLMKLAGNPWFQEFVAMRAPERAITESGGDSLKLAQMYLGGTVLDGKQPREWDDGCDRRLMAVVEAYETWAKGKGYNLDE
jgi:hypothetical protein